MSEALVVKPSTDIQLRYDGLDVLYAWVLLAILFEADWWRSLLAAFLIVFILKAVIRTMTDHISHIRVPMTIHTNDYNLCGAKPSNADLPLREARRTARAALEGSVWNICKTCLGKLYENQH